MSRDFPSFDSALVDRCNGRDVRYLIDPLADEYLVAPGDDVPTAMLPPEEWEVRRALVDLKLAADHAAEMGPLTRIFNRAECAARKLTAANKREALRALLSSSRAHQAALRRIVGAMPLDNGGREALTPYLR